MPRVFIMPTSSSLMALQFMRTKTCGAANYDKLALLQPSLFICIINAMVADDLASPGPIASAPMVLNKYRNFYGNHVFTFMWWPVKHRSDFKLEWPSRASWGTSIADRCPTACLWGRFEFKMMIQYGAVETVTVTVSTAPHCIIIHIVYDNTIWSENIMYICCCFFTSADIIDGTRVKWVYHQTTLI